jgi:hypothetical protein
MLTMATRLRARESGGATASFARDFAGPHNATRSSAFAPSELRRDDLELQIVL